MSRRSLRLIVIALCAALPCAAIASEFAGRWLLVEQTYNGGRANFAPDGDDGPARLALVDAGDVLTGTFSTPHWSASWPLWPAQDGAAPLVAPPRIVRTPSGGIEASYRVAPAAGDDTTLAVVERCRIDGARLICDVEVRFDRAGVDSGGFTWHRVFTREVVR